MEAHQSDQSSFWERVMDRRMLGHYRTTDGAYGTKAIDVAIQLSGDLVGVV